LVRQVQMRPVYRAVNKPLTIWGVERRLFFLALVIGGATFNYFGSLISGIAMFVGLYAVARWATATDQQMIRILLNAGRCRAEYDPGKRDHFAIEVLPQ
jgi:type IV secretory pathway VirB3-like protein